MSSQIIFWPPRPTTTGVQPVPPGPLPASNPGDVWVNGNASLNADTVVTGDLIVTGNLTNTGGYALQVGGDLILGGGFLFTPASTATAQGTVSIGGDFYFFSASEMKVNPGQNPGFTVTGDMNGAQDTFDGSANAPEANGLALTVYGEVKSVDFTLNGGDSAGVANAGHGGNVNSCTGFIDSSIVANGGASTHAGFNGGNAGLLQVVGIVSIDGDCSMVGGACSGATGNGGAGGQTTGTISAIYLNGFTMTLSGGNSVGGTGGNNGGGFGTASIYNGTYVNNGGNSVSGTGGRTFSANGAGQLVNVSYTAIPGNGATPGQSGGISCHGDSILTALNISGGSSTSGNGTSSGNALFSSNLTLLGTTSLGGGAGNAGSGTGGNGGTLTVQGVLSQNGTLTLTGGTGNVAGTAGSLVANSTADVKTLSTTKVFNTAAKTTLNGSAGTAVCSQPEQGSSYKKVLVYLSGYTDTGTQTYTFPTAFTQTPFVYGASGPVAGATATTTTVTFTVTTQTGFVFIEGY